VDGGILPSTRSITNVGFEANVSLDLNRRKTKVGEGRMASVPLTHRHHKISRIICKVGRSFEKLLRKAGVDEGGHEGVRGAGLASDITK
jgi:hypothetical protein